MHCSANNARQWSATSSAVGSAVRCVLSRRVAPIIPLKCAHCAICSLVWRRQFNGYALRISTAVCGRHTGTRAQEGAGDGRGEWFDPEERCSCTRSPPSRYRSQVASLLRRKPFNLCINFLVVCMRRFNLIFSSFPNHSKHLHFRSRSAAISLRCRRAAAAAGTLIARCERGSGRGKGGQIYCIFTSSGTKRAAESLAGIIKNGRGVREQARAGEEL